MARRDGQESVGRTGVVVSRSRPVDRPPSAAMRAFSGPRVVWTAPGEADVVGCGAATAVTANGRGRYGAIRAAADDLFESLDYEVAPGVDADPPAAARPRLLGGFAFHEEFDAAPEWAGFPGARFVLPHAQVVHEEDRTWLTVTADARDAEPAAVVEALDEAEARLEPASTSRSPPPGIASTRRTPDREGWRRQVTAALSRIDAGELEKVVLAQTLTAELVGSFRLADTLSRLAAAYPDCYRFAVDPGMGSVFFGATPERLITRRESRVETEALAGSVGRGGTPAEDERLARRLVESEKIQHEQGVVVDAVRDQLGTAADSVRVGDQSVRKLANVQHLYTPIAGELRSPTHVLELVEALHPTPAVGGLPPDAARATIRETERFDRGWYAAPVGWFDGAGNGTFAVGIRSAVVTQSRATLFAGNGIVADSDPDEEWEELQLKYRPILDQLR